MRSATPPRSSERLEPPNRLSAVKLVFQQKTPRRPLNPYLVLLVAILLPGMGYVICGETRRGFTMQMFMVALAFVTWHLAPPQASFVGRISGGLFIYALSLPDTYRRARLHFAVWEQSQAKPK
jgi:hypothetical protein